MGEQQTEYEKAVNWRLDNIEKALTELKDVMVDNKLQARDISDLNTKVGGFLDALNAHEKRIRELELAPTKQKADRWQAIIDKTLSLVIDCALIGLLVKIGLSI